MGPCSAGAYSVLALPLYLCAQEPQPLSGAGPGQAAAQPQQEPQQARALGQLGANPALRLPSGRAFALNVNSRWAQGMKLEE